MAIKTTLNIHKNILDKIEEASRITGRSNTDIIIKLLMLVMSHDTGREAQFDTVQYQKADNKEMWETFHIKYNKDQYDYFLDLRKFMKMSVSCLVAYAVKKYIYKILSDKNCDNYYFNNYILSREMVNGVIHWKIFWGIPEHIEDFIHLDSS